MEFVTGLRKLRAKRFAKEEDAIREFEELRRLHRFEVPAVDQMIDHTRIVLDAHHGTLNASPPNVATMSLAKFEHYLRRGQLTMLGVTVQLSASDWDKVRRELRQFPDFHLQQVRRQVDKLRVKYPGLDVYPEHFNAKKADAYYKFLCHGLSEAMATKSHHDTKALHGFATYVPNALYTNALSDKQVMQATRRRRGCMVLRQMRGLNYSMRLLDRCRLRDELVEEPLKELLTIFNDFPMYHTNAVAWMYRAISDDKTGRMMRDKINKLLSASGDSSLHIVGANVKSVETVYKTRPQKLRLLSDYYYAPLRDQTLTKFDAFEMSIDSFNTESPPSCIGCTWHAPMSTFRYFDITTIADPCLTIEHIDRSTVLETLVDLALANGVSLDMPIGWTDPGNRDSFTLLGFDFGSLRRPLVRWIAIGCIIGFVVTLVALLALMRWSQNRRLPMPPVYYNPVRY